MGCKQAAHLGAKVLQENRKKRYLGGGEMSQNATGWGSDLNALVVVGHAVDVAVMVDGEGHAVQGLGAHHAAEAAGVVRVPESLQDLKRDIPVSAGPGFVLEFFLNLQNGAGGSDWLGCSWCVFMWHKYGKSL